MRSAFFSFSYISRQSLFIRLSECISSGKDANRVLTSRRNGDVQSLIPGVDRWILSPCRQKKPAQLLPCFSFGVVSMLLLDTISHYSVYTSLITDGQEENCMLPRSSCASHAYLLASVLVARLRGFQQAMERKRENNRKKWIELTLTICGPTRYFHPNETKRNTNCGPPSS